MLYATVLQSSAGVEWANGSSMMIPEWLGITFMILAPVAFITLIVTIGNAQTEGVSKVTLAVIVSAVVVVSVSLASLITTGFELHSVKKANKASLQGTYGIDLSDVSEDFLVHGVDTRITDYQLQDDTFSVITLRVELKEYDGVTRGKLVTVNSDGSTSEVPEVARLKPNSAVDAPAKKADSDTNPKEGRDEVILQESELREYLDSITGSTEILKEINTLNERITALEGG